MSWQDDERLLLEAAKGLEPDAARSRERLLLRVSTASAVSLAAASVKAAIAVEATLALKLASVGGMGMAKATVIGGALGAATVLAADRLNPVEPTMVPLPTDPPAANEPVSTKPAPTSLPSLPVEQPVEPKPVAPPALNVAEPSSEVSSEPQDEAARESQRRAIEALDAARAAVVARDPDAARAALDDYDAQRRDNQLDPEAALLRLRTLQLAGQCEHAAALAEQWLVQQPQSTYANALRALVKECRQ